MAKSKFALVLILLLSLLGLNFAFTPAAAAPDEVKWSRVNIPTEGRSGNWVLASGSGVGLLTIDAQGTLYAYVSGLAYTLYKSTDGGYSWSYTGNVTDAIVALAVDTDDSSIIYYATASGIYKSADAGKSFFPLAANPGGAGASNIEITSIDVARLGNNNIIVVGTRDTDAGEYGGVYVLDEGRLFLSWQDTNLGNFDVYAVALSPHFASDRQIVAVITDETDSFVSTRIGGIGWGRTIGNARLDKDNSGNPVAVNISADIVFPGDYSSDLTTGGYAQLVAINTGGGSGDVYAIYGVAAPAGSVAIDLNIGAGYGLANVDVTSLAVTGNATAASLLAGAAAGGQVYYGSDGGISWTRSSKQPTGQSNTYVLMTSDFASSGKAYAATSGSESAFSVTQDGGATWNQISLIDTGISSIIDLALSPGYSRDSTLFMLTYGSEHSLWRSLDGGARWQRVFSSSLAGVDRLDLVQLSPQYGNSSQVVFIAGSGGGNPVIWKSADNGQSFTRRGAPLTVDQWVVVNDTSLFTLSYDGSSGLVYYTANSGLSYSAGVVAGSQSLSSIALSPNYGQDGTILVGNTNGWVYWSSDNGVSFEPLPSDAGSPPLTGNISVAFDPQFGSNNIIYAASDIADKGIYRFIIGTSTSWQRLDSSLPSGGMVGKLVVSDGGILYAVNFQQVDTVSQKGGMERCLKPKYLSGATFETVTGGLDNGATLWGLWFHSNQLWSIDTTYVRLMTFYDSLTQPVTLTSPANRAPGIGTIINDTIGDVSLDWETLSGATGYQWQLDYDADFSSVPAGFEGTTQASSVRLPALAPATTYYWRVRATGSVLSPWSARWSFTTSLGGEITAPRLESPQAGASGVPVRPVFQWSAVAGADGYELVVSADIYFGNPSILKINEYALPGNAWQSGVSLNYDTTYYWKVRAISSNTYGAWSAVGAFTTEPEPAPEPEPSPPPLSAPPQPLPPTPQPPATPDWAIYLIGLLALAIISQVITILVLVIRRR